MSGMYSSLLSSTTLVIWKALESYGCDSRRLFESAGLDPSSLYDAQARYPYASIRKLWKQAIEETGDPCFALVAASLWHPANFHGLGFAWLASKNLKEALLRTIRYFGIVTTDPEQLSLVEHGNEYHFIIDTSAVVHRGMDEEYDLLVAILVDMCRASSRADFNPLRVLLERPTLNCADRFAEFFGTDVEFAASKNMLVFRKQDLEAPLPTANAELARSNEQVVQEYLARIDRSDIVIQVKTRLIEQLPSGHVSEDAIANSLNMSLRTLQRRLREEGLSYKELLNETRRDLALQYIQDSRVSINQITYMLGFSECSNFSRAFKRWTGRSPTAYRLSA